jgi:hypothetical protein
LTFSSKFAAGSAPGVRFFHLRIRFVRAAAFAAAAACLFAGTAPHQKHGGDKHNDQEKQLRPIHAANITANAFRATAIFSRTQTACRQPVKRGQDTGSGVVPGFQTELIRIIREANLTGDSHRPSSRILGAEISRGFTAIAEKQNAERF